MVARALLPEMCLSSIMHPSAPSVTMTNLARGSRNNIVSSASPSVGAAVHIYTHDSHYRFQTYFSRIYASETDAHSQLNE